jgi:hypothetical protein
MGVIVEMLDEPFDNAPRDANIDRLLSVDKHIAPRKICCAIEAR